MRFGGSLLRVVLRFQFSHLILQLHAKLLLSLILLSEDLFGATNSQIGSAFVTRVPRVVPFSR